MHHLFERTRILAVLCALAFCLPAVMATPAAAQDIAIVVNKDLPVSDISAADLKKIFMGNQRTWDSGEKIAIAIWDDPDTRDAFLKKYVKKSGSQYKNYWKSRVFTGKGSMPPFLRNQDDVAAFVSGTSGAIAFIGASGNPSVKTITVK